MDRANDKAHDKKDVTEMKEHPAAKPEVPAASPRSAGASATTGEAVRDPHQADRTDKLNPAAKTAGPESSDRGPARKI